MNLQDKIQFIGTVLQRARILKAGLGLVRFLAGYTGKFKVRKVGRDFILHSHLPPLNSRAYDRFIDLHLLGRSSGPSHAQIGVTKSCPQRCGYCYNKTRKGKELSTPQLISLAQDLRDLGVFWLGLTGGEPLLNKDLEKIVASVADDCAVKLFTTGCGLTLERARSLKQAGVFSACVSLDHVLPEIHDQQRGMKGAWKTALKAVSMFLESGMHTGVSAVVSAAMLRQAGGLEEFLGFLEGLGIHEAWLSEAKPALPRDWAKGPETLPAERQRLAGLQDAYNRKGNMTLNFLGHFEGREHFGCNAGHKMIYVDAFGDVCPCVFIPASFGNVRTTLVSKIWREMLPLFPARGDCFINSEYKVLKRHYQGRLPLAPQDSRAMAANIAPLALPEFSRLLERM
jgi:MoaA/NifB/PqqE/SkfB family radical SAM enzyme